MALRYWVGGTASWDGTAGTKWALTDGGAGGQPIPTSADDVFLTAASGASTVQIAGGNTGAKSITCTGFTGTVQGVAAITVSGSVTLVAGMTYTHTGAVTFDGTGTLTTAGKTFGAVIVNGPSITLTLGDALNISTRTLTVTQGTFTTNNYSVTAGVLSSNTSSGRTINLGSSVVTLSSTTTVVNFATTTNLTFNAGTSTISCTGTGFTFAAGGLTYYNVSFTSTAGTAFSITGSGVNTFNDLTVAGRTSAGIASLVLSADQVVLGTLTLSAGSASAYRTFVRSSTIGTSVTLTCAAVAALTDIDFRDITIAGTAAPVSGTRLGDCKGNSGITFDTAKTVYFANAVGTNWGGPSAVWALTNGGAADSTAFPLAQDTAVFTSTTPNSGSNITVNAGYNIGAIDMSARTSNTMTLSCSSSPFIHGSWTTGTGITFSGTGSITFCGRNSQTITSAGRTFTNSIFVDSPGGSVTLQDAFTSNRSAAGALLVNFGTFDANNYNVSLTGSGSSFSGSSSNVRTIAIGSGTWTIAGSAGWTTSNSTNLTLTGTGTISMTSASPKQFTGGGVQTFPSLNQGGSGTLTITGSNKFVELTNSALGAILFAGGTTNDFTYFSVNGTSAALRLVIGSTNTTQAILRKPSAWNIGTGSLDGGNNTGLSFTAGSNNYLNISYINGVNTGSGVVDVYIIEATTASDTAAANAVFVGVLSETATAADVNDAANAYLAAIEESTTAVDLAAATVEFSRAIAEITTASDTAAALKTMTGEVSETTQAADTINGGLLYLSSISEATTASEIANAFRAFTAAVLEATSASEIAAAQAAFLAVVPEQVSGSDLMTTFATLGGSVTELAAASDAARRAKIKFIAIEDYIATEATTTAMTVEATVTGNTASGTVESGQITATVLP